MNPGTEPISDADWKEVRLADIGDIVSGGTPSTSNAGNWDGPIAWITPADLSKLRTRYLSSTERTLTDRGLTDSAAKLLPAKSLVVSSRAPIGHMALPLVGFCTNQGCKTIVFCDGQHPEFHYYNLRFWVRRLHDKGEGTTFSEISKSAMEDVIVPVPNDGNVQVAIAGLLGLVDLAIEQTQALLAKQQRIKAGLMHDLFTRGIDPQGNLRDPSRHQFKPSPLGSIPREWEVRSLANVASSKRPIVYGILMPGEYVEGGVYVIKVRDIQGGIIKTAGLLKTHPNIDAAYSRSRLQTGDLLFTIRGSVGRMAVVPPELHGANITQDSARISVSGGITTFVRHCLEMPRQRAFIELHTIGQAVKGMNLTELRKLEIPFPSYDEQDEIAFRLDAHDRDVGLVMEHLTKLRRIKTGLMRDLLTGRVPVTPLLPDSSQ